MVVFTCFAIELCGPAVALVNAEPELECHRLVKAAFEFSGLARLREQSGCDRVIPRYSGSGRRKATEPQAAQRYLCVARSLEKVRGPGDILRYTFSRGVDGTEVCASHHVFPLARLLKQSYRLCRVVFDSGPFAVENTEAGAAIHRPPGAG